ncbi:MAG: HAMP domain-containing histidine kinase [Deltaproteobacteria bacterium]|nr:HAMP domain-containing histidine kinase [Deltaproteobacteria bacterium]
MGASLAQQDIRLLMRAAAAHDDFASTGLVREVATVLGRGGSFDCAGLLLQDGHRSLRFFMVGRNPDEQAPLGWGQSISFEGAGSLAARLHPGPAVLMKACAGDPIGDALIAAGLGGAALAPIATRWVGAGLLCVAAREPAALQVDLDLLAQAGEVLGLLRMLRDGARESVEFAGLEQLDYLATMGRLSGGLVHEVNNPATFIALAAGQMEKVIARSERAEELAPIASLAHEIAESTRQMRAVVSEFHVLSTVARHAVSGSVDIGKMIRACATLTTVAWRTPARIEVDVGDLPSCPASFASLAPVVVNLLLNAIQAIPAGKDESQRIQLSAVTIGERLHVTVRDTGTGIPADVLPRVFDPFFTTRPAGQAAGLGLTLARETVRRLHGEITIESAPGEGTCVKIELPIDSG